MVSFETHYSRLPPKFTTRRPPLSNLEALLTELSGTGREREQMAGALDILAFAPVPVRPPAALRNRIVLAIQQPQGPSFVEGGSFFARASQLEWDERAPGIHVKTLYFEPDTGSRTALVRLASATAFPPHTHRGIKDVYMLEGEMWVGEVQMRPGDYCRAPEGSDHADVRSGPQGSLSVVVSR